MWGIMAGCSFWSWVGGGVEGGKVDEVFSGNVRGNSPGKKNRSLKPAGFDCQAARRFFFEGRFHMREAAIRSDFGDASVRQDRMLFKGDKKCCQLRRVGGNVNET